MVSSSPPSLLLVLILFLSRPANLVADIYGPKCWQNTTSASTNLLYPCQTYAFYRANTNFPDLAAIGDLFDTSRVSIARASNISDPTLPLYDSQPLLVPITCDCFNSNHSYAQIPYQIKAGDNFWTVSTYYFGNLTNYQTVELVNPKLVPTNLIVGVMTSFPVFCQCPDPNFSGNHLVTYVTQPGDTFQSIASSFEANSSVLVSVNGGNTTDPDPYSTIVVPIFSVPISLARFEQGTTPSTTLSPSPTPEITVASDGGKREKDRAIIGLGVAVGVLGTLLFVLVLLMFVFRKKRKDSIHHAEAGSKSKLDGGGTGSYTSIFSRSNDSLIADLHECLDKYRVFTIDEIRKATSNFNVKCLTHGSVFKGTIGDSAFAIKKMKWNADQELRILQKVNHTNLVKLEGFCINSEDGGCYLVYEYLENGSLQSWLDNSNKRQKLEWRSRLKISLDVASGLQYIHEHTWPTVVHKDISSSNILLDGKLRGKIANFGLARSGCNAVTTNIVGTQGYVPPEYLIDGLVTTKMDVFAFGVVLLELISGKEAVNDDGESLWTEVDKVSLGSEAGDEKERFKSWIDPTLLDQGCLLESVASAMAVAKSCVLKNPSHRPGMVDIVYALSKADELHLANYSGNNSGSVSEVLAR